MKNPISLMQAGVTGMRMRTGTVLAALALFGAGCDLDLDITNPNAPTEQEVVTSLEGVLALSLGMQQQFASSIHEYVRAPALITDEWGTQTRALAADQSLFSGTPDPGFGVVSDPYYDTYRVARTANIIIASAPTLGLSQGLEVGLLATAKLFKAMALGMAAQHFETLPLDAAEEGAVPVPREQVFAEVIRLLESARSDLGRVSDAELATFRARGLTTNFDLRNTVDAMLARYYLFTEQYQQALDAAQRVNLNSLSVLNYSDPDFNPIWNYATQLLYVAPLQSFVTEAEPGDDRVGFWVNTTAAPFSGNPPVPLLPFNYFAARNAAFPVYLPAEMLLIRAEAQARLGNLAQARELINQVRAREATANTPGASLPPLPASELDTLPEILAQIAYERRYELFSQGLRWEDLRRLGQYTGEAPKLDFLPFPESECRTNPNANC
jgi:starch-binding outer membrane protein, SusD/RagB family